MASKLTTQLAGTLFSSAVPDLHFSSSGQKVSVKLWEPSGAEGSSFLAAELDVYNQTATLYEVRDAVEEYMLAADKVYINFSVSYKDDTENNWHLAAADVVYCKRDANVDAASWLQSHFLTTRAAKQLPVDGIDSVACYMEATGQDVTPTFTIVARKQDCSLTTLHYTPDALTNSTRVVTYALSASNIAAKAAELAGQDVKILSVAMAVGARMMTWYVSPVKDDLTINFKNCFGIQERAPLNAVTEAVTSDSRKVALVARNAELYNISPQRSFEVQTALLSSEAAKWIDELLTSNEVYIDDDKVIITDYTYNVSNNRESMSNVKFTYRYVSPRAKLKGQQLQRVFTQQYDYIFN